LTVLAACDIIQLMVKRGRSLKSQDKENGRESVKFTGGSESLI